MEYRPMPNSPLFTNKQHITVILLIQDSATAVLNSFAFLHRPRPTASAASIPTTEQHLTAVRIR